MRQQSIELGQRFGRWEVVDGPVVIRRPDGRPRDQGWHCRCECGTPRLVAKFDLVNKKTQSCGCLSRDLAKTRTTHGGSRVGQREALYGVWNDMRTRCDKSSHHAYKDYGERGIRVCDDWQSYAMFRAWALANGYTEGLTLDRTDNSKGYNASNCRWVDRVVQMNNTRANHWIEAFGERHTIAQWAKDERCKVQRRRLSRRIANGWSPELAISVPVRTRP